MIRTQRGKTMIPRGAFLAAVLVVGGFAAATGAIPSGDQVISGCFVKATGALRVIDADAAQKCKSSEASLSWNQVGLKGEPGDVGPAGPAGEQGPAGEPGASGAQDLFFASRGQVTLDYLNKDTEIVTKALPAGSYRVEAQISVENPFAGDGLQVGCSLAWDGAKIGAPMEYQEPRNAGLREYDPHTAISRQIELVAAATHGAGQVAVVCRQMAQFEYALRASANLVATRVASVG